MRTMTKYLGLSVIAISLMAPAIAKEVPTTTDIAFARAVLSEAKLVSPFGVRHDQVRDRRTWHGGIDLGAEWDAAVHAPASGEVVYADTKPGYGKTVDLKVSDGWVIRVAHLSAIKVKSGDLVDAGNILGQVGSTGPKTPPHLHLETRYEDKQYDPELVEGLEFFTVEADRD